MQNSTNLFALSQDCTLYDARKDQVSCWKKAGCSEGEPALHVVSNELHISANEWQWCY